MFNYERLSSDEFLSSPHSCLDQGKSNMEIESNTRMRQRWRYLKVGRECGDKVKKVRKRKIWNKPGRVCVSNE